MFFQRIINFILFVFWDVGGALEPQYLQFVLIYSNCERHLYFPWCIALWDNAVH